MKTKIESGIHVSHHQKTLKKKTAMAKIDFERCQKQVNLLNTASFEYSSKNGRIKP
jgi:hypothetical protein